MCSIQTILEFACAVHLMHTAIGGYCILGVPTGTQCLSDHQNNTVLQRRSVSVQCIGGTRIIASGMVGGVLHCLSSQQNWLEWRVTLQAVLPPDASICLRAASHLLRPL